MVKKLFTIERREGYLTVDQFDRARLESVPNSGAGPKVCNAQAQPCAAKYAKILSNFDYSPAKGVS